MRHSSRWIVVLSIAALLCVAAWIVPPGSPLCCGGDSQVGRFGKLLAVRAGSGTVVAWDAWRQRRWTIPSVGTGAAQAAAKGNAIVFIAPEGVMLGDMHTGVIAPLSEAVGLLPSAVMVSDDARFVAVAGSDAAGMGIWLVDREKGARSDVHILPDGSRAADVTLLALSSDGRYVAYRHADAVWVFDALRGRSRVIWSQFDER